jgi:hypothetical protein
MYPPASLELRAPWASNAKLAGEIGLLSLTIILMGLIVIWAGYVKTIRWTWVVMFIIVFGWASTELLLPLVEALVMGALVVTPWELVLAAVRGPGIARNVVESILTFSLMVIALFLPARAFFSRGRR